MPGSLGAGLMFELRKTRYYTQNETTLWIGEIGMRSPSVKDANTNAPLGEFFDRSDQMNELSAKTIETPDDELVAGAAFAKRGVQPLAARIISSGCVGINGVAICAAKRV